MLKILLLKEIFLMLCELKLVERDAVASIIINKRVKYIDNDGYVFCCKHKFKSEPSYNIWL